MPVDLDIRYFYFRSYHPRSTYTRPLYTRHQKLPKQTFYFPPEPNLEVPQEPATKPANVKLLTAALAVSAMIHGAALYFWPEPDVQALFKNGRVDGPRPVLKIALRPKSPAPKPVKKNPSTLKRHKNAPPQKKATSTSRRAVKPNHNIAASKATLAASPTPPEPTPSTTSLGSPSQKNSRVFHPHLQQQINKAKGQRSGLPATRDLNNHTWINANDTTVVDLGYDGCLKSQPIQSRGVTQDWYVSNCVGRKSEGENMLDNMQRELDTRNGKR